MMVPGQSMQEIFNLQIISLQLLPYIVESLCSKSSSDHKIDLLHQCVNYIRTEQLAPSYDWNGSLLLVYPHLLLYQGLLQKDSTVLASKANVMHMHMRDHCTLSDNIAIGDITLIYYINNSKRAAFPPSWLFARPCALKFFLKFLDLCTCRLYGQARMHHPAPASAPICRSIDIRTQLNGNNLQKGYTALIGSL